MQAFTKQAGRCLVTTAEKNGRRLYAVTLNAPSDWDDHEKLYGYGFSKYITVKVFGKGAFDTALTVVGGVGESAPLYIKEDETAYLTEEELEKAKAVICMPWFEYAPLHRDMSVGYVSLVIGKKELARAELFCGSDVPYKTRG
jgi:D-alanyl-D-alanine carboxypeptidase/D-alanyl-D-alanine carboxypeptidase (penicillin-binding protein 5/6)